MTTAGPDFRFVDNKVWLGGILTTQKEVVKAIELLNVLKNFLPNDPETKETTQL